MTRGRIAIRIKTAIGIVIATGVAVMQAAVGGAEGQGRRRSPPLLDKRDTARWFSLLLAILLCQPADAQSETADPHTLFEDRCSRCHGHAGAFARDKLTIENSEVVGRRSGKPVLKTLASHFGKLSDAEAELIVDMFRRQIESGGLYESRCRFCHDPARDLARQALIMRHGRLTGRYSGRSIEKFLSYHGGLEGDELAVMLDMLAWQLTTIANEAPSE